MWQGKADSIILPVNGRAVAFQRIRQTIRAENITWEGRDADNLVNVLLTLGKDHVFGRVIGSFGTLTIAPDVVDLSLSVRQPEGSPPRIAVKRLSPAHEVEFENDYLVPPHMAKSRVKPEAGAQRVANEDGSRIDVMVLYTNGMAAANPGDQINTRIQYLLDQGNTSFSNSNISTQFNLVHSAVVSYTDDSAGGMEEALDDLTDNLGVFAGLEDLRTTHGADQVVLLRQYVDEGCGLAWLLMGDVDDARYAYAVIHDGSKTDDSGYYCSDLTYVHEIGHNLGSAHDRDNADPTGIYDYSYGYQSPAESFRTVMAYNCPTGCPRISYFSNPDVLYQGETTGVLYTETNSADNARTINQTRVAMANYRAPAAITWTVTPSAGSGGTITPSTPQSVVDGATTSFTIAPDSGYSATVAGSCGGALNGASYTTNPVTANCTVEVGFLPLQCAVTQGITTPSHSQSEVIRAETTLTAGGGVQIGSGLQVIYEAGSSISLTSDFHAATDSRFQARITPVTCAAARVARAGPQRTAVEPDPAISTPPAPIPTPRYWTIDQLPAALLDRLALAGVAPLTLTDIQSDALGGRFIFSSEADLIPEDNNGLADVYRYHTADNSMHLLSHNRKGGAANGASDQPRISGDGNWVVFRSDASDLSWKEDTNGASDIYLYHLNAWVSERASRTEQGDEARTGSAHPDLAGDLPIIVYDRADETGWRGIYQHQLLGDTQRVDDGSCDAHHPILGADGRYLAWLCGEPGSTADCSLQIHDRKTGAATSRPCEQLGLEPGYRLRFDAKGGRILWSSPGGLIEHTGGNPLNL